MPNNIDYSKISSIDVKGNDEKITNQDARVVTVSKDNVTKKTSDLMLGNDNKNLSNEEFISIDEYVGEITEIMNNPTIKKIQMIKSGKKIASMEELQKHIEKVKEANLIVLEKNKKVDNQDSRLVSINTKEMDESKVVAGMFLGKNGPDLAQGEYTTKSDLEFKVIEKENTNKDVEFEVIKKEKKQIPIIRISKGLGTIAVTAGLIALIPWIMHANSTLWHHVSPVFQNLLHGYNNVLGTMVAATYENGQGLWSSIGGELMNADAAISNVAGALATHGVAVLGVTKVIADIKSTIDKIKGKIKSGKSQEEEKNNEKTEEEINSLGGK